MNHLNLKKTILVLITFTCITLILNHCKGTAVQTAGVHYQGHQDKAITLRSTGYGKNKKEAVRNAEKNAFDVLLFKGILGSPFAKPIIAEKESRVKAMHASYFSKLYDQDAYKNFVIHSSIISSGSKDKQTRQFIAGVELTINVPSLRRDLEQKGLIKKFGF